MNSALPWTFLLFPSANGNANRRSPTLRRCKKLADLFDTSIDELCGRPPKPEDAMDNMSVMCRAFRQMKPEEQEKYLAVGKALFASAFAPAAPAQDDDAAE